MYSQMYVYKTLMLYAEYAEKAWRLLDENAGLYGDNGGNPDGTAWLPSDQLTPEDPGIQEILDRGWGKMVEVVEVDLPISNDVYWAVVAGLSHARVLFAAYEGGKFIIATEELAEGGDDYQRVLDVLYPLH